MKVIFLLFLFLPILEIAMLIKIGGLLGVLPTVGLVVLTAVVGVFLLKMEGFQTWQRLQMKLASGEMPAPELAEGVLLMIGGALLLTPGFITDTIGFFCLIPFTRRMIAHQILQRSVIHTMGPAGASRHTRNSDASIIIEGEYTEQPSHSPQKNPEQH